MMPVIRIHDSIFERLQKHATPFVDTPASVIERLLDAYETSQTHGGRQPNPRPIESDALLDSEAEQSSDDPSVDSWPGFWFVNVGESDHHDYRNWEDCAQFGFLAAGRGRAYTEPLRKLAIGSKIFAYMKGLGYVGFGEVVCEARPAKEFIPEGHTESILELPLQAEDMDHDRDDRDQCEWVVGVKWHTTLPRDEAKTFSGIFANQHIVCKLRDRRTLDFLRREFNVPQTGV
jgi:hypothetical protein